MDLPKRKQLRLPDYDYSSPGAYFVSICTQDRRCILSDISVGADAPGGPNLRLTKIGEVVEKYISSMERIPHVHVDKYVIMPNHIHMILVVEPGDGPPRASAPTEATVPHAIGAWKRLVNRELGEQIFQRGYYEHVIRGEDDYRQVREYIDANPAKWAEDRYYTE